MVPRAPVRKARAKTRPTGTPVVASKLTPPNPPARALPRRGLVRALLGQLERPIAVVVAEAGYGKTTLLAEAARAAGRPVIWYSLARSDADVMVFTRHLIQAFRREIPRFGRDLEQTLDEIRPGGSVADVVGGVLSNEWGALRGPEHLLVLDDFHEVAQAAPLLAMLDVALRIPPPGLRIWIASREAPPLALERLRAQGKVLDIDSSQLAFSKDEVERLFADVFARPLSDEDADRLLEVTRGWPTAIQMVDHAIERSPGVPLTEVLAGVADAPREMRSYLSEEVLARLAPETNRLLERTVVFDRFDPEMASDLSGIRRVEEHLTELTRRGLLRSFGEARAASFGWHELVRHAVRARVLARDGEEAWNALEGEASRLLQARGELEPALAHAVRTEEPERIAPLVRELAPALLRQSRPAALLDALGTLPDELVAADAVLRVHRGDAFQALGRWDEAAVDYQAAIEQAHQRADRLTLCRALTGFGRVLNRRGAHEQALGTAERGLAAASDLPVEIRARLLQTKAGAHFYLGQTAAAIALLGEVRTLLEGGPHHELAAATVHNMALARVAQGRFAEAAQDLRAALAALKGVGSPRAGLYLANLATILVELGELGEARTAAEAALESARRFSNPLQETMAHQALALVSPSGPNVATAHVTIVHDALDSDIDAVILAGSGAVDLALPGSSGAVSSDWVDGVSAIGTIAWTFEVGIPTGAASTWLPPSPLSPWTLRVAESGFANRSGRITDFRVVWHTGSGDVSYSCQQLPQQTVEGGVTRVSIPEGTTDVGGSAPWAARLHPNPVRPGEPVTFALPAGPREAVDFFDLAGRCVGRVEVPASAAARQAVWQARDARGAAWPAGVYLARLGAGRAARLVVLGP